MRLSSAEKQEIIELVDRSEDGVNQTLKGLGIHKSTFYKWYRAWLHIGPDGVNPKRGTSRQWNSIPESQKQLVIEIALENPAHCHQENSH